MAKNRNKNRNKRYRLVEVEESDTGKDDGRGFFTRLIAVALLVGLAYLVYRNADFSGPLLSLRIQANAIGAYLASLGLLVTIGGIVILHSLKSGKVLGFGFTMMIVGYTLQSLVH